MKQLYIIKLGETFDATAARLGDFEQWIRQGMAMDARVVDPRQGDELPAPDKVAGAVITGSHAMITEQPSWSLRTGQWLLELTRQQLPVLGICYGHQLLAQVHGGEVAYHPQGMEVGTTQVQLQPGAQDDPLLGGLPADFPAQVVHSQSVRRLPPGATLLASSAFEPIHAFRLGSCAWGVQFHPEFSKESSRAYVRELAPRLRQQQQDPERLEQALAETPDAASVLQRFARLVQEPGRVPAHR